MSKLEQLINELCPDGVEYRRLENCCEILDNKRKPVTKSAREAGEYPYYGANGIQDYVSNYIFDGTFVLVGEDGSVVTEIGTPIVTWATGKIWVNNHAHIISEINGVLLRYLFHYLQTVPVKHLIHGNIPKLTGGDFRALKIAVPPLPVQEEIVRILDKFMELTAELTAELTTRKQQYEYYRDQLISFRKDMPLVELGKLATDMYRGAGIKRDEVSSEGTPCVRYGEIYTTYNVWFDKCVSKTMTGSKTFEYGDVLFAITGESVEEIAKSCAYVGNEKCFAGGDIVVMKHEQNPKYMAYALSTTMAQKQKSKGRIKSKVVHSNIPAIKEIKIPIPFPKDTAKSLAEQQRIVDILDRFDKLCNDISEGLPAEIEARQKQYEYYRDKLLTFKKKEAAENE